MSAYRIEFTSLSELQRELLLAASNVVSLQRAKGGYVAVHGGKPFTVRTVLALQRMGLITLLQDGRKASITHSGNELLATGRTSVSEAQAG